MVTTDRTSGKTVSVSVCLPVSISLSLSLCLSHCHFTKSRRSVFYGNAELRSMS